MSFFAVAPLIPSLASLLLLIPAVIMSALAVLGGCWRPRTAWQIMRFLWLQKYSLFVLILLAVVTTQTLLAVARLPWRSAPRPVPNDTSGGKWPMLGGTATRRAWLPPQEGPFGGRVNWRAAPRESFFGSPAVAGQSIYAVGSRGTSATIYCFDAATGGVLWSTAPHDYLATISSPVVAGDKLIVGEGLHWAKMARIVCVDLRPGRAGEILWTFATRSHVECTPVVADDRVYVNAGDDGVYCLRLDPDVAPQQRVVWHAPGSLLPDAETSLVVNESHVLVGLGEAPGKSLCALDAETGRLLARIDMPYPVFSPPAIHEGKLYVGMGTGNLLTFQENPAGQVCCIDLKTMKVDWTFDTRAAIFGALVVADEQIVVGSADGSIYVLDRQGQQIGRYDSRSPILAAPAVTRQRIYFVNNAGQLTALDRHNLRPVWDVRIGGPGTYSSAPIVAHGRVYVGTDEQGLVCVGQPPGEHDENLWTSPFGGSGMAGCRDRSLLPDVAQVQWHWPAEQMLTIPAASSLQFDAANSVEHDATDAPPHITSLALAPGAAILALQHGTTHRLVRIRFEPTGTTASDRAQWFTPINDGLLSAPLIAGDRVIASAGLPTASDRKLICVDLRQGGVRWQHALDAESSGLLGIDHQLVWVQDEQRQLTCLNETGSVLWRQSVGTLHQAPTCEGQIVIVIAGQPAALMALDRLTGHVLWRVELALPPTTAPVLLERFVYFGTAQGVRAYALVDGRLLWSQGNVRTAQDAGDEPLEGVLPPLYVDGQQFFYLDRSGRLIAGTTDDGQGRVVVEQVDSHAGLLVAADAVACRLRSGQWVRLARWGAMQPVPWLDTDLGNTLTGPLVLGQGRVLGPSASGGVVCLAGQGGM